MDKELNQILEGMSERELERARASCLRHGDSELAMILERHAADDRRRARRAPL